MQETQGPFFFPPLGFEFYVDFSWRSFQLLLLCDASIRIDFLLILRGDKNDCPEYRRLIFFFHLFFFVGNWSCKLGGKKVEQNNSRSRHSFSLFSQQIPAQSEELYIYIHTYRYTIVVRWHLYIFKTSFLRFFYWTIVEKCVAIQTKRSS